MRWNFATVTLALALALPAAAIAQDDAHPTHPVRLIMPSE
jgi:hypothetical protein